MLRAGTLLFALAGMSCASLPDPWQPDVTVSHDEAPALCGLGSTAGVLTADGNAVGWADQGNVWVYDFAMRTARNYPSPNTSLSNQGQPTFSPDGRYAACLAYSDTNALLNVFDLTANTAASITLPDGCGQNSAGPIFRAEDNTLHMVCTSNTVYVFDTQNPNSGPKMQVSAPSAASGCDASFSGQISLEPQQQVVAVACGSLYNESPSNIYTWSYGDGTAHLLAAGTIQAAPKPLLSFPNLFYLFGLAINPSDAQEVAVGNYTLFTMDTNTAPGSDFEITRMLDKSLVNAVQFTDHGDELVASVLGAQTTSLRAWRLSEDGAPFFNCNNLSFNFSLSPNGVLGACDANATFNVWRLRR